MKILAIVLIATLNLVCFRLWFKILKESKPARVNDDSNCFPIIEPNPVQRTGTSGCVLWLSLCYLILGAPSGSNEMLLAASFVPIVWLGAVAQSERNYYRHEKERIKSKARIELLEHSIQFFDQEGTLSQLVRFDSIIDLAKYQGFDTKSRNWFNISVLKIHGAGEIVIPESTISLPLLLKKIERVKQQKFQYRRNSTRHKG